MIQDRAGKWRKNIMHWRHDLWDLLNRHCHRTRYGAKAYQVVDPNWTEQGVIRPLDYCKGKRPETLMLYVQLDSEAFLTALRQHRSNCLMT